MPIAGALAGDTELTGDLGLAEAGSEQLGGAQPTGLEALPFCLCRWTAGSGWHPPILLRGASSSNSTPPVRSTPKIL
jgi:hypothetical protein